MAKILRCSNIIPGCTFVATGKTPEEVFHRASEHVRLKHKFRGMSPEVMAILHGQMEDDSSREFRAPARRDAGGVWRSAAEKRAS
jgi:predicted small metal-binding protein